MAILGKKVGYISDAFSKYNRNRIEDLGLREIMNENW
jgi:hypothetical protein